MRKIDAGAGYRMLDNARQFPLELETAALNKKGISQSQGNAFFVLNSGSVS